MVFALVRAYSPPFVLFSIFGTIALDVVCVRGYFQLNGCSSHFSPQSIGPLYPFPNYRILNSMLIASSSFCAIGLVCCLCLFPETVNHAYLGLISVMLEKVKALLAAQDGFLSPQLGDYSEECPKLKALIGLRAAVMTMYQSREYSILSSS